MNNKLPSGEPGERASGPMIFCDFDGTIAQPDVTDQILSQLAHPSWREVEQAWVLGLIGSRECLERQIALVEATPKELDAVIDSVEVDAHFSSFYRLARKRLLPFYILSEGFDYPIRRLLKRAGLAAPFRNGSNLFSSALRVEGRRLIPSFPHSAEPCPHGCATCKARIIRRLGEGRQPILFVGDGLSDRFAVEAADIVFAKRQLLAYCRERGIAAHPFETFKDVQSVVEKLLAPAPARRFRQALAAWS